MKSENKALKQEVLRLRQQKGECVVKGLAAQGTYDKAAQWVSPYVVLLGLAVLSMGHPCRHSEPAQYNIKNHVKLESVEMHLDFVHWLQMVSHLNAHIRGQAR